MHFAYLHSFLKYGILFWENSRNLKKMFKLQQNSKRLTANISSATKLQTIIQIIKDYVFLRTCCKLLPASKLYQRPAT
jgi:hypothetical protein